MLQVSLSLSLDGFAAGPDQDLEHPLGVGGQEIMDWVFPTDMWRRMHGHGPGEAGVDNEFAQRGFENIGAWILGRNMFGPIRGAWPDEQWRGWWGEEPPYHVPVFVLTHHARAPLPMQGGTEFRFVTGGVDAALAMAVEAAAGKNLRVGGGAATVRQFLKRQLVDELHLASMPVLLGRGESLFAGLDMRALGYRVVERRAGERATHLVIGKGTAVAA